MNNDRLVRYNIVFTRTAGARHPVHPVRDDIYMHRAVYTPAAPHEGSPGSDGGFSRLELGGMVAGKLGGKFAVTRLRN